MARRQAAVRDRPAPAPPDGWLSQPHVGPLEAASLGHSPIEATGIAYPGTIEISLRPDGSLTGVNVVPLETYLEGVVPKELGRPGHEAWEAQLAQAVAARTYAIKRLGSRADLGFDVYGSVLDQAYQGVPDPADSLAVRAVRSTRGEVMLYNGYLIDAFYHSTCGGQTARVEETFDLARRPVPDLRERRAPRRRRIPGARARAISAGPRAGPPRSSTP